MVAKFEEIDFHDDTVISISIEPSTIDSNDSIIVTLYRHWENRTRIVKFHKCGNVSLRVDFHVLRDNAPNNTVGANEGERNNLAKAVNSFRTDWNVCYDKGLREPVKEKLKNIKKYSLYKLLFFGGVLEVLAKRFSVVEPTVNKERRYAT